MAEPLCVRGAYAARIHHGRRNDRPLAAQLTTGPCYYIVGVYSGTVQMTGPDGLTVQHRVPCAFLLPPGGDYTVRCPPASHWEQLAFDLVHVPLRRVGRSAREHIQVEQQPGPMALWGAVPPVVVPDAFREQCLETLRFCGRQWWQGDNGWVRANGRLHYWLTEYVLVSLAGPAAQSLPVGQDPWIQRVRELVANGIDGGMSAAGLAQAMGMSREHLRRRLQAYQLTPGSLLIEHRMARAYELLAKADMDLEAVARFCGYRSLSAFSAAFKKHCGMPPGRWRKLQVYGL